MPDEARRAVKSVYIRNEELQRWGYTASCGKCQKMRVGLPTRGMAHTSACRARIELAMAEADDPRWNAATDRIAHRLADSVAAPTTAAASGSLPDTHVRGSPPQQLPPPEASPATPVLTEDALFDAVFPEEEPSAGPSVEWLPIDVSEAARMDFYNTEEFQDWPVGLEEDYMTGLLTLDTSFAERREANEIVELFLTLGAELPVARQRSPNCARLQE